MQTRYRIAAFASSSPGGSSSSAAVGAYSSSKVHNHTTIIIHSKYSYDDAKDVLSQDNNKNVHSPSLLLTELQLHKTIKTVEEEGDTDEIIITSGIVR